MKRVLDEVIAELLPRVTGLRAVVLSAAPDGVIAWCWSRESKPELALGFAALERSAAMCLDGLGAAQRGRSLLLKTRDTWVVSWPLREPTDDDPPARLVVTAVFEGELLGGMVMVYGARVRSELCQALEEAAEAADVDELRARLTKLMVDASDPLATLAELARAAALEPAALGRLGRLDASDRERVSRAARGLV